MAVTFYASRIHKAGFDATAEPSITTQGYACSGAEATGPAYDLVDNRRTNLITIDTNGETTDFTVDFDLTANITSADFAIIDNQNFATAEAAIVVEHGAAADIGLDNAYSGALGDALTATTIAVGDMVQMGDDGVDGILLALFGSAITDSAWDLSIADYDGNTFYADVTMGEVAIGVKQSPSFSPELGSPEGYMYDVVDVKRTEGGQKYGFSGNDTKRQRWQMAWKHMTAADKTKLETVFDDTRGMKHPFWIDFGLDATPRLYFVRFTHNDLNFRKLTADAYQLTITVEQL